jgi:hypothetical protein
MTAQEFARLIRPVATAASATLTAKDAMDLNSFLDKLESLDNLTIDKIVGKMARWTPPTSSPAPAPKKQAMSASVRTAIQALEALYADVKTWSEPEYDAVRDRVAAICAPLKAGELVKTAKEFTGRGASSQNRDQLVQLIANPILSRLENRFMFVS